MKKIFALVLCLCMVMSMSAIAMAATGGDVPSGDVPSGDIPSGDIPSGDVPSGDLPSGDNPAGDTPIIPGPSAPSTPSTPSEPEDKPVDIPFVDVEEEAYYYDALEWAVEMGITEGTTETTFSPKAECTRAQMVTFLWRVAGEPVPKSADHDFTDVDADAYYHDALLWAIEMGITNGTTETTFSPAQVCTRGQMAAFLFRYVGTAVDADHPFDDVDEEAYYAAAIAWAFENGITTGTTETTFSPADGCTRAQMVTFLYRCFAE